MKPKREYTEDAKKALKILSAFLEKHPKAVKTLQVYRLIEDYRFLEEKQLPLAEKYIQATIRQEKVNK